MPSPGVDTPCSLLVFELLAGNCWAAPRVKQEGKEALKLPAQKQLLRAVLSTAPPLWSAPHHFGENKGVAHEV